MPSAYKQTIRWPQMVWTAMLGAAVAALVLTSTWAYESSLRANHMQSMRSSADNLADLINDNLLSDLNQKLQLTESIRTTWRANNHDLDDATFTKYARMIIEDGPAGVRSLQLAPGGVIKHVYPKEGNEAVIGINILAHRDQGAAAQKGTVSNDVSLVGPFELIQGGQGLVARLPLYIDSYEQSDPQPLWGLATVVLDAPALFNNVSEHLFDTEYAAAIRYVDGTGAPGAVFFGDKAVFALDPLIRTLLMPGQVWEIGVVPHSGWPTHAPTSMWVWLAGTFIAGSFALLVMRQILTTYRLREARYKAEEASRAKSAFLSNMSHELRTPMNAVLGFSQMLQVLPKEPLSKQQNEYINIVVQSGKHLLDLINQVLDLAKIQSGTLTPTVSRVNPRETIDQCLNIMKIEAEKRDIEVGFSCDGMKRPNALVDDAQLKQIMLNLISNAIKYNREGGHVHVSCEEARSQGMMHIEVSDSGLGIPKERLGELFEPFNRLNHETTSIEGTGIGLSITKELVNLMGGVIGVKSELGVGSTFWIDIPIDESDTEQPMPCHKHSNCTWRPARSELETVLCMQTLDVRPEGAD